MNTKIKWEKTGESPQLSENLEQAKFRPGPRSCLKTGVENDIFWSEISSGFGEAGGTLPPRIVSSTGLRESGTGCKSCHHNHRLENVG